MTNNKNKIANPILGSIKQTSEYRSFNEQVAEMPSTSKTYENEEYLSGYSTNHPESVESTSVNSATKRACKTYTIDSLFGLPRAIILVVYQNCKLTGSNMTKEITMDHLVKMIGSSKSCIKTTISRLKAKKLIATEDYKTGRGGWAIYRLSENLYRDIAKMEASRHIRFAKKV
jgi:predicted transcriptional regulator